MAVPAFGILTMLGIAQERKYSTYGSGNISSAILITDLINGGGPNGFPSLNTSSPSKPNTSTPHSLNEWYGYDQDYVPAPTCISVDLGYDYKDSGRACVAAEKGPMKLYTKNKDSWSDEPLYSDSSCGKFANSGWYSNGKYAAYWDNRGQRWDGRTALCGEEPPRRK